MLVLYFVTDQGSQQREVGDFVMGAVLGLRIVVPEALRRPFGQLLLAAAILQRSGVTVCQLRCRQTHSQVSPVGSTLVGELARWERNWPSWCLLGPAHFSSTVT